MIDTPEPAAPCTGAGYNSANGAYCSSAPCKTGIIPEGTAEPEARICVVCGAAYTPSPRATRRRYFCSKTCGMRAAQIRYRTGEDLRLKAFTPETLSCRYCGETFTVSEPGDARTRFCSRLCSRRFFALRPERRDAWIPPLAEKTCAGCGETRNLDHYQRDKTTHDGFADQCDVCAARARKAIVREERRALDHAKEARP